MNSELKQAILPLSVIGIVAAVFVLLTSQKSQAPTPHVPTVNEDSAGRTIMLHTSNWKFSPNTIKLKKGENVSLHLMGIQGNHGVSIPGLGVNQKMGQGDSSLVKIPTDKTGTYPFHCNVSCGPGHAYMEGTIIIE